MKQGRNVFWAKRFARMNADLEEIRQDQQQRLGMMKDFPEVEEQKSDTAVAEGSKQARFKLVDVVMPTSTENEIREALIKVRYHGLIYQKWGFEQVDPSGQGCVLNFYGPPGTGKSRAAEALAGELGMPFLKVDLAELESKFMGETPKNLKAVFQRANTEGALLFFDEADTVLGKRLSSVTQGVDAEINLTRSTMLIEMDGFSGVLVFASNFPENYDSAFRRRISHHIRFDKPDQAALERLWDMHLVAGLPLVTECRKSLLKRLAEQSSDFTGGYILQAMRLSLPMAVNTDHPDLSALTEDHLRQAILLVRRGLREVGEDVQENIAATRELFGISKPEEHMAPKTQEQTVGAI
jgi:SpoVK/Ycf46/Vps4 family AAA+-type ATPase